MKNIGVVGAGIIGICTAFFLQKSGFKVTLLDHNQPGSGTSYGHACTFADYACVPVNSPTIYKEILGKYRFTFIKDIHIKISI